MTPLAALLPSTDQVVVWRREGTDQEFHLDVIPLEQLLICEREESPSTDPTLAAWRAAHSAYGRGVRTPEVVAGHRSWDAWRNRAARRRKREAVSA